MKSFFIFSFIFLLSSAFCEDLNSSYNNTLINDSLSSPWYVNYGNKFLSSDNSGLIAIIIGLGLAYFIGKIAFKFIKLAIIILLIMLLLRIIF
jgi:Ca2+-dependent lipid-binding protein